MIRKKAMKKTVASISMVIQSEGLFFVGGVAGE